MQNSIPTDFNCPITSELPLHRPDPIHLWLLQDQHLIVCKSYEQSWVYQRLGNQQRVWEPPLSKLSFSLRRLLSSLSSSYSRPWSGDIYIARPWQSLMQIKINTNLYSPSLIITVHNRFQSAIFESSWICWHIYTSVHSHFLQLPGFGSRTLIRMEFIEPLLCLPGNSSDFSFHASVPMLPKLTAKNFSSLKWMSGCLTKWDQTLQPGNPCNILQPCKPSFMNLFWASWRPISSSWLRFSKKIWSTSARCCSFCDLQGRELDTIVILLGPESTARLRCWETESYTIEGLQDSIHFVSAAWSSEDCSGKAASFRSQLHDRVHVMHFLWSGVSTWMNQESFTQFEMLASVENKSELGENTELMLFKTHTEATSIPFSLSLSQMPKKGFELFTLQLNILDISTRFCSPLHDLGHVVCPWPSCDQPNRPPTIAQFWSRSHGLGGKQTQLTRDDRLGALPKNDVAQLHSRLAFLTLLHCLCSAFTDLRRASFIDVTLVNCGSKLDADISRPLFAHAFLTWFRLASVFLHPFSRKEKLGISRFSSEAYTVLSFAVLWQEKAEQL